MAVGVAGLMPCGCSDTDSVEGFQALRQAQGDIIGGWGDMVGGWGDMVGGWGDTVGGRGGGTYALGMSATDSRNLGRDCFEG